MIIIRISLEADDIMESDHVEVEIHKLRLRLKIEDLTALEVNALAQMVSDRMARIERETKVPDSAKLAIITALEFAAELRHLTQVLEDERKMRDYRRRTEPPGVSP